MPRDGSTPRPTTKISSARTSPTMVQILVVPTSMPTTTSGDMVPTCSILSGRSRRVHRRVRIGYVKFDGLFALRDDFLHHALIDGHLGHDVVAVAKPQH